MRVFRRLFFLFLLFAIGAVSASNDGEPPHIGNFSLPRSQQPHPLLSFGQNIVAENELQLFRAADKFTGRNQYFIDAFPYFIYGLSDKLSMLVTLPIARYKQDADQYFGLRDTVVQLEHAFYNKQNERWSDQATIVGNLTFPTGSVTQKLPTGFGSPSIFIGTTFSRTSADWFSFTSYGATFTTQQNGTKFGDIFYYQLGLGRNLVDIHKKWIIAGLVELDGQYSEKEKIEGIINPDSGGNVVYLIPSLWISSKQLTLQFGAGWPVAQHLFGKQNNNHYLLAAKLGWSFW